MGRVWCDWAACATRGGQVYKWGEGGQRLEMGHQVRQVASWALAVIPIKFTAGTTPSAKPFRE